MDSNLELLNDKIKALEIELFEGKYVFKNLPLNTNDDRESEKDTFEIITDLLGIAGLPENSVEEAFRLLPKIKDEKRGSKKLTKSQDMKPPSVFVKFSSKKAANHFLKRMKDIRENKDYANFQVDKMIPKSLMPQYEIASANAYKMRKTDNMITRVEIEKLKIVLKAKKKEPNSEFTYIQF